MSHSLHRLIDAYFRLCAGLVIRTRKPRIVGITGSVGKTTTKEVVAAVLSQPAARDRVGDVLKTPGNLNDNTGLPMAILRYSDWTHTRAEFARRLTALPLRALRLAFLGRYPQTLVLEYAASEHGSVPKLAALAPPTVAVVTAIGPAHLEIFGSIERITREKGALVRAVPESGLVVLGADNPYASAMDAMSRAPVVKVSGSGRLLSDNIARAVGSFFGVPEDAIEAAIKETPAVWRRLKPHDLGTLTVIDDSISANPLSTSFGLKTLGAAAATGRKVAILGFMAELGPEAVRYHQEIGTIARENADVVVGIGTLAQHYAPHRWYETVDACIDALPELLKSGDVVLVKGSQVLQLEHVVAAVRQVADRLPARATVARSEA